VYGWLDWSGSPCSVMLRACVCVCGHSLRAACLTDTRSPGYLNVHGADVTTLVPAVGDADDHDHAGMVLHPVTDLTATELSAAIR
jgi:hypothetical protein